MRAIAVDRSTDSLRSVSWPQQTPYKMWRIDNGYLVPLLTVPGVMDAHSMPRQVLPEIWWQSGLVDVIRPRTILDLGSMAGERILPFVVDEPIVDIDYEDALVRAEQLLASATDEPGRVRRHPG